MITSFQLPLTFDPQLLKADLVGIAPTEWVSHFNQEYFDGEWSGIALRSIGGNPKQIYPDPHAEGTVANTPMLERCPNIRRVLESFGCPVKSARLLKLSPGSCIREHRDYELGFAEGEIRLHIPVATEANVAFFLAGKPVKMNEGECWYLDFSLPHRVEHRGVADRIHLVIDCVVNDWLLELFPPQDDAASGSPEEITTPQSSPEEFERFRQAVLQDTNLQQQLRETSDRESFVTLVWELANERGYRFSTADVQDAMQAAQRAWIERWIE